MGVPLIIIGLIFLLNGVTWFEGEEGVGEALVWIGGVLTLLNLVWFAFVAYKASKATRDIRSRW